MRFLKQSKVLVHEAFLHFQSNPPDLRGIGDQEDEITYVKNMLPSYVRTVSDVMKLFENNNLSCVSIIELGAFLGIVSKALSLASATVVACDIPEFFTRENVKNYYRSLNLEIQAFNLRNYHLPFPNASQDCVIACETFEHLNFNPLPVISEINRVLKPGGVFYLTMPNGSYFLKRLNYLISGNTPGFTVDDLYSQLNQNENSVVNLHWKEYSPAQTIQMITPIGFEVLKAKTHNDTVYKKRPLIDKFVGLFIPGGDTQVIIFKKFSEFKPNFSICADS